MARELPQQQEKNSTLAFVLLCLYTTAVLIRPHEMFLATREWIMIKVFAILCCITILIAHRPLKLYPQHWMLLALVPIIIISGFANGSGMFGIEGAKKLFVSSIIPLFLYTSCITSIKRQHILMFVCLIAALLMVHNGHTQQIADMGKGWALFTHSVGYINLGERIITYLGFFNDPNDLGMFLVMCAPFTVYFYKKGAFFIKIIMLLVLSILVYGVYLTGSRGTMLGLGSLVGIYFLITHAGPKLFIASIVIAPIAATALASLQSGIDDSANGRLYAWYDGIQMAISHPAFGIGKGRFIDEHGIAAHNSYVLALAELGVIGYTFWGGALIFTVLSGYLFIKRKNKYIEESTLTDTCNITKKTKTKECKLKVLADEKKLAIQNEYSLNQTLFFSIIGFMITGFFLSRTYTLLLFIFMGMTIASHIRLTTLEPKLNIYFNNHVAKRAMVYCWLIIVAVYAALKIGL